MVRIKSYLLTVLAALIFSTSFAPLGLWFAAPVAYAIYLRILCRNSNLIFHSFLFGFLANAIILSWSKTFVGVTPWLLLAVLQGLYLVPVGFAARYLKSPLPLIAPILLMDELKSYFPFGGFGWSRIGFSQVESPLISMVSIVGVIGISLITLLIALLLIQPNRTLISALLLTFLLSQFVIQESSAGESLQIRAVQGGVPERGLSFNSRAQAVLDNHIKVTRRDIEDGDDLLLWPENAIDVDPLRNFSARKKIVDMQAFTKKPLLAGAILSEEKVSNAAVLFDESATAQSIYIKRYLTPFGEYIPLRSIASAISPHVDRVSDFTPGDRYIGHKIEGINLSSIICYEILSDQLMRESGKKSQIIAVMTNSATFAGSAEGEQQLSITRIRAIESGRNIVSVSTTGPTAFIDYRGEVLERLNDGEVGSISMAVEARQGQTIATRFGGEISSLLMLISLSILGYSLRTRRVKNEASEGV